MAVSITKQKQGKIFWENILNMFVILSQTKRLRNLDNLLVSFRFPDVTPEEVVLYF